MRATVPERVYTLLLVASILLIPAASASVIQPTRTLPPAAGVYNVPDTCIMPVCLGNITIANFVVTSSTITSGNEVSESNATLKADVFENIGGTPGLPIGPVVLTGSIDFIYFGRSSLGLLGTFNARITGLDLSGTFNSHTAQAMLNPDMESTGVTTINEAPEGGFLVTSFFDVFGELSIDGGSFVPGPPRHADLNQVPEPATFGLVAIALFAGARFRRSRRA